jgi:acyl-CoA synthetase (AMP-forming)/AMP-acid ligase II
MEAHFASVWEAIADDQPDEIALVQGDRELTWRAYEDRASRLAAALRAAGVGRDDAVALYLRNCPEYAETTYAATKNRAVPVNVNYRYLDDELLEILHDAEARAVVFHSGLADRIARVATRAGHVRIWIEVADPAGSADSPPGTRLPAVRYEDLIAGHEPAPRISRSDDDHWLLYTGGTTGRPRGVVYRVGTLVTKFLGQLPPMLGLAPVTEPARALDVARTLRAEGRGYVALPACPLMHGVGQWRGVLMPHLVGGAGVLLRSRSLNLAEVWTEVERCGVVALAVVGDPVVRPLIRHLRSLSGTDMPDLSRLRLMFSSGAMLSSGSKAALHELIGGLTVVDAFGASEASFGSDVTRRGSTLETGRFTLAPTARVFDPDGRPVAPGSGGRGLVAVSGDIPQGYHRDPIKTAAVFQMIDGVRYAVPGDWVRLREDGSAIFLGRDSSCINSGGEKVFPEEVEEVLKSHRDVEDGLVVGVPDERFGRRVAAVASAAPGSTPDEEDVLEHVRRRLAAYKVPVGVVFVPRVPRHDNGKADHAGALRLWELHRPSRSVPPGGPV